MTLFGWGRPKCSVDVREKAWIETRLRWLGEQFGVKRLSQCSAILPPEMRFRETFDATPKAAQSLFEQVCRFMEVNPSQVTLKLEPPEEMTGMAGYYESGVVHVTEANLGHPVALTSTMAHELAHHILIGRNLLDGDQDKEWTTDLTPIVFGLGIFSANATIFVTHESSGQSYSWSMVRKGYLPSRMFGYALALHSWLSIHRAPDLSEYLRQDAADAYRSGLHYLRSTEDSLLRPENLYRHDSNPSPHQLIDSLERGTGSEKIAAFWELAGRGEAAGNAAMDVAEWLTDRSPTIRAEAARTLARLGPQAAEAVPLLLLSLANVEAEGSRLCRLCPGTIARETGIGRSDADRQPERPRHYRHRGLGVGAVRPQSRCSFAPTARRSQRRVRPLRRCRGLSDLRGAGHFSRARG